MNYSFYAYKNYLKARTNLLINFYHSNTLTNVVALFSTSRMTRIKYVQDDLTRFLEVLRQLLSFSNEYLLIYLYNTTRNFRSEVNWTRIPTGPTTQVPSRKIVYVYK